MNATNSDRDLFEKKIELLDPQSLKHVMVTPKFTMAP